MLILLMFISSMILLYSMILCCMFVFVCIGMYNDGLEEVACVVYLIFYCLELICGVQ